MSQAELESPPPSDRPSEEMEDSSTLPVSESISHDEVNFMTTPQAWNLYTTHFLSTWNVRTYEFAAIIFTAAAYPDTLVAAAIRGIVRTLASIFFSSMVGRWVDSAPSRLKTLIATITINRFSVISASVLWFFIVDAPAEGTPASLVLKGGIFTCILFLGVLETLSASGNMLSMERDWVVTASSPEGQPYDLTHLNSTMRRIDLICKLIAPILISVIVSATNVKVGVLVVCAMSTLSWGVEWWCAKRVWNLNARLRAPKHVSQEQPEADAQDIRKPSFWSKLSIGFRRYRQDFKNYFSSKVWAPSLALSFLHLSALSYSATFITFLLNVGFSLDLITLARAAGSVVEISSTVVTPVGVQLLSKANNHGRFRGQRRLGEGSFTPLLHCQDENEGRTETGLERLGLWGISWQLINLVPVIFALWSLSANSTSLPPLVSRLFSPLASQATLAFVLFFFLSISRLGLWIYDLTTQQLTQTMVPRDQRSSFTGVEYSFVSLFELGQNVVTIVLHKPEQFKWIAIMSWVAVATSTVGYAAWVWRMRGHLVHWERIKGCGCAKTRAGG